MSTSAVSTDHIDLLVHNVSHSDLCLSINNFQQSLEMDTAIGRPKFSHFRAISESLLATIQTVANSNSVETRNYPKYTHGQNKDYKLEEGQVAVGYQLNQASALIPDIGTLRFRREDKKLVDATADHTGCYINGVYFPLMAVLIPRWLKLMDKIETSTSSNRRKVIILITGRGTPMDKSADSTDNSTKFTGKLLELFIKRNYPSIEVIHLHSRINLFRYDDNVIFVKNELKPRIDQFRNDLASKVGSKWKDYYRISISFADGSSARISAIQQALRHYKPISFHFWQLKTFWSELKICDDDIECHSYETIAAEPAIAQNLAPEDVRLVVKEMENFRDDFYKTMKDRPENDLASFWLRKSLKPVLAVLLVQKPNEKPQLYRATNVEVSLPTGSLCAERNVIGTALGADLSLKRQDLKMVAVYSLPSLTKIQEMFKGQSSESITTGLRLQSPVFPPSSNGAFADSPIVGQKRKIMSFQYCQSLPSPPKSPELPLPAKGKIIISTTGITPRKSTRLFKQQQVKDQKESEALLCQEANVIPSSPTRVRSNSQEPNNCSEFYEVIQVDENDMNPLKPCGACQEWLKKISEANPSFTVVTFTDYTCSGVYVENMNDN